MRTVDNYRMTDADFRAVKQNLRRSDEIADDLFFESEFTFDEIEDRARLLYSDPRMVNLCNALDREIINHCLNQN